MHITIVLSPPAPPPPSVDVVSCLRRRYSVSPTRSNDISYSIFVVRNHVVWFRGFVMNRLIYILITRVHAFSRS